MLNFCEKCKGAISVFLTLILLPTFIFGGVIVDGSRILGAKNMISGAGELAMNAALSNYNEELNQTYGLLAMAETPEEVEAVMKDFFETTLNAAGVSQEDFNKAIIYLELTDDFSAVHVEGSEIYETEVIRQEILEYMKYRAPVTLAERVLNDDRLGNLEHIQEEKNAADGQIKFESEMEDVQALFDEIKELTDRQEELYDLVKNEAGQNSMLDHASDSYDEIAWLTVAYKSMNSCSKKASGDTLSLMEEMCHNVCDVNVINQEEAAKIIKMIQVQNGMAGKNPSDILKGLDPYSDEYREKQKLIEDYNSACENMQEGITNTEKQLDELVTLEYTNLSNQRKWAVEGEENCIQLVGEDGTGGLINDLEKKFAKLQAEYDTWNNAVHELPDGESKTAYQANINEVDDFFKKDGGIADFKEKALNNKTFYNEVWTQLDLVTFTGKRLDEEITDKSQFEGLAPSDAVTSEEIRAKGNEFKGSYVDTEISLSVENIDLDGGEFVTSLKEKYCKPNENSNEAEANKNAEAGEAELEDNLKKLEELFTSSDILEGEENPDIDAMGGGDLPSNWLGIRTAANAGEGGGDNNNQPQIEGGLKDKDARKNTSDSGSAALNTDNSSISAMSSLPEKLSGIGAEIAKPLYMTEYVMGMFSYYTCDKDKEGNAIEEPESINGKSLKDNAAYRAEVEYILWGDPDVRDNVGMTKAVIFAANLVFNMSFVFTNQTIRTQAAAIAALFPVPVVGQTAIKCAFQVMAAMIETVKNLIDICDGKAVPLVKTDSCWSTWLPFGSSKSAAANGMTGFTYEDYLWIFVCMNMFIDSSQTEMLARTADCIELNMTDKKADNDNTLKSMFTMLQLEAAVSVDTYFLDRLNGAGYDVQEVDEETFKIPYTGIQGY